MLLSLPTPISKPNPGLGGGREKQLGVESPVGALKSSSKGVAGAALTTELLVSGPPHGEAL